MKLRDYLTKCDNLKLYLFLKLICSLSNKWYVNM